MSIIFSMPNMNTTCIIEHTYHTQNIIYGV